jgi:Fe-S-cluster formation regulator IscX/YfhJ
MNALSVNQCMHGFTDVHKWSVHAKQLNNEQKSQQKLLELRMRTWLACQLSLLL